MSIEFKTYDNGIRYLRRHDFDPPRVDMEGAAGTGVGGKLTLPRNGRGHFTETDAALRSGGSNGDGHQAPQTPPDYMSQIPHKYR